MVRVQERLLGCYPSNCLKRLVSVIKESIVCMDDVHFCLWLHVTGNRNRKKRGPYSYLERKLVCDQIEIFLKTLPGTYSKFYGTVMKDVKQTENALQR